MLPRAVLLRPTKTWAANTLPAIEVLLIGPGAVILMFTLRRESAKEVFERLGCKICHNPLPVARGWPLTIQRMLSSRPV
jgi:hypothetical protein